MEQGSRQITAAVVKEANGPFVFEDVLLDEPQNGEVSTFCIKLKLYYYFLSNLRGANLTIRFLSAPSD